jgi:hypothetical protein
MAARYSDGVTSKVFNPNKAPSKERAVCVSLTM